MSIKVALCSSWHVHAQEYAEEILTNSHAELAGIWDGSDLAGNLSVPNISNLEDILCDESINGVLITAPTTAHEEIITACAKAGKHIFTEKVLTPDISSAKRVTDRIKDSGKHFCISFPYRTYQEYLFGKGAIDSGLLGDLTSIRFHKSHDGLSSGWLPQPFLNPNESGGGAMLDLGCHGMYIILWIAGMPDSIQSIFNDSNSFGADDNSISVMHYLDGCIASNETSFIAHGSATQLIITGTQGCIIIGGPNGGVWARLNKNNDWKEIKNLPPPLPSAISQWISAIKYNDNTLIQFGIKSAFELTVLMDAAYRSGKSEHKIKLKDII